MTGSGHSLVHPQNDRDQNHQQGQGDQTIPSSTRAGGGRTRDVDAPRLLVECFASTSEGAPDVAGAEQMAVDAYEALIAAIYLDGGIVAVISDPSLVLMLLMIGVYGLLFEFMNPGFVAPGVIGGVWLYRSGEEKRRRSAAAEDEYMLAQERRREREQERERAERTAREMREREAAAAVERYRDTTPPPARATTQEPKRRTYPTPPSTPKPAPRSATVVQPTMSGRTAYSAPLRSSVRADTPVPAYRSPSPAFGVSVAVETPSYSTYRSPSPALGSSYTPDPSPPSDFSWSAPEPSAPSAPDPSPSYDNAGGGGGFDGGGASSDW